jgi:hypothetical protein
MSCSWAHAFETVFPRSPATPATRRPPLPVDLQAAMNRYLGEHNRKLKPFPWTVDPHRIIETTIVGIKRWRQPLAA